ncbi:hypothetical protein GIB67_007402 [Kingdonia uniflora]|uniref:DUF547 domain-containing protein n=1 Tax=Kingdonia uniflora TaxID=39325 RepID=A0A7J7MLF8_9MAGN|nr:hypothetical protein GIB67_007402 [Kingdonia uniflora]
MSGHIPETSNRLSEDMIKCIAAIYCKLVDPSLFIMASLLPPFHPCQQSVNFLLKISTVLSCRSLVCRLEDVNPRKMKHDEKLAFWMNIHNALVMHVWTKFKSAGDRQAYAIEQPLLQFKLCSGSHSDAAVRVYTPKRVFHQLEVAKEEYLVSHLEFVARIRKFSYQRL